jgi:hypothetical protein
MSDELKAKTESLIADLVKDVKEKMPIIAKIKQMAQIAKELEQPTEDVEGVVDVIESFGKMVIKKFDKTKKIE